MEDPAARHEAIRRSLAGQRPTEMCRALGCSKLWLYKWLMRDARTNASGAQYGSRAPQQLTTKPPAELERLVYAIRQRLVPTRLTQRGAYAIQGQLQQLGVHSLPEI